MNIFKTSTKLALKNLRSNWPRTILSLLGIIIGVTSVVVVLSLGSGVKNFVLAQIEAFGSNFIEIEVKVPQVSKTSTQNAGSIASGTQITTFKLEEAEKVAEEIDNITAWYAGSISQQVTSFRDKNKQAFLMGVTDQVGKVDNQMEVVSGRPFSESDSQGLKQVAILGSDIDEYFFPNGSAVGKNIKIKGQSFEVIGVLKKRGASGFFNFDDVIYLPLETLQKKILGVDHIQFAIFELRDMNRLDFTVAQAESIMRSEHDITDPEEDDFAVSSVTEIREIIDNVFFTINLLLLGLTSIALIVGGVGIMNVMYVAVTERTFEIGIRKSVGARRKDILFQFLVEAVFLTIIGGILGILIGIAISLLVTFIINNFGINFELQVTSGSILLGFIFSAAVGIIFGVYPARRASDVSPMEAIRYQ